MTQVISIGEAGSITVDEKKFSAAVNAYIFNYGLKQMLNDVHAGETAKKTPDEATRKANKLALVEKKLASLYAGEVAQARAGGDPVEREMRAMAEADLKAQVRKLGKKPADYGEKWKDLVAGLMAKRADAYRAAAIAKLAIKVEVDEDDIDLDDLMGESEEAPAEE